MSEDLPFVHPYNLNRLGQAGDTVTINATDEERIALARFSDLLHVDSFAGRVELKKTAPNRFRLDFTLTADIRQACVVTLVDVPSHIERRFSRDLHFSPASRRAPELPSAEEVSLDDEDSPEEISTLHYDLTAPLIEEFLLAIDPYPRAPGVEFRPPSEGDKPPESPFAVLKGLKSGL
ncbi:MAG: YceD family protein [Rhizomicrobium sp.]